MVEPSERHLRPTCVVDTEEQHDRKRVVGQTFDNACQAEAAGVTTFTEGACGVRPCPVHETVSAADGELLKLFESLTVADLCSPSRNRQLVTARQIAMYLSRQLTESSLNTIGEAFGGRDHGTVLHACRLVKDRTEVDANVRQSVQFLEKQLMR